MKLFPDKSAHANRVNRSKMLIVYLVREAEFNNNRTTNFSLTSDQKHRHHVLKPRQLIRSG